jgi:hypothetical protein
MSSRVEKPHAGQKKQPSRPAAPIQRFDKAFPVFLDGERGIASGIGRNITDTGMFVETREPFAIGTRVKVTFTAPGRGVELTLEAEVRYQCFINFVRKDTQRAGMRGVGLKFVEPLPAARRSLH